MQHRLGGGQELVVAREERRRALVGDALHVAAAALDQQHERDEVLAGDLLGEAADVAALSALLELPRVAAADGEILAADDDVASVDRAEAHHVGSRGELDETAALVAARSGERADLVEGAAIEELVEALADGEPAALVLARDAVRLAALEGALEPLVELVDLVLPDHARPPSLRRRSRVAVDRSVSLRAVRGAVADRRRGR